MSQGWISLNRKIMDHQFWNEKPFSRGQAWVDLLLLANYKPATLVYGNTVINLDRGQFHTSELKLSKRWGWSRRRVHDFLSLLHTLEMATTHSTPQGTTITIENYGVYQNQCTTLDTVALPSKEQRSSITNNINKKTIIYPPEFEIFFQQYPNPKDKQRTFASWSKAIKSSTAEEILAASRNYANETKGREKQYIKTSSNFLGRDQIYKDYLVREEKPKPKPRKIIIQEIDR